MSFIHQPSLIHAGRAVVISPDGSDQIPAELWGEYAALVLLQPEPELLATWTRRLEDHLGVREVHRAAVERQSFGAPPKPASTGRPWTILRVTPMLERKVAETLTEAGLRVYVPIETYLPKTANVARSTRPWRPRTRPLIPGYLFAELKDDRELDIARANHAVRLWCVNGQPVSVPALAIGFMAWWEGCGAYDKTRKQSGARKGRRRGKRGAAGPESRWRSGQRIRIGDGPFAGFLAEIVRADRDDRVEVLVSVFGRMTPITLDEACIEGEGEAEA